MDADESVVEGVLDRFKERVVLWKVLHRVTNRAFRGVSSPSDVGNALVRVDERNSRFTSFCTGLLDVMTLTCWEPFTQACNEFDGSDEKDHPCYVAMRLWDFPWWTQVFGYDLYNVFAVDRQVHEQLQTGMYHFVNRPPSTNNTMSSPSWLGNMDQFECRVPLGAPPIHTTLPQEATTCLEPSLQWRGDVARVFFYLALRDGDARWLQAEAFHHLKRWHVEDPVDDVERIRNRRIHAIQGTRNPWIDYPNWLLQLL